ncbi:hypothetical protein GGTG_05003 [Gaeumannomyces tritici R3-111a-1]|uniref:Uncharacterized protein n=1 Tax=Gaeumannomyces tritici (strain R3-111a-1) TaxID=644352 RepID=J3NUP7_GAET3|nr:hypothetical protein GGTG_05003 [Gaeumannomyces tritici R3-111a-1]EJT79921.1 hypothetical protein GGTG_05003 [Gaeumannomyces tritici R3-111a-1]
MGALDNVRPEQVASGEATATAQSPCGPRPLVCGSLAFPNACSDACYSMLVRPHAPLTPSHTSPEIGDGCLPNMDTHHTQQQDSTRTTAAGFAGDHLPSAASCTLQLPPGVNPVVKDA